MPASRCPPKSKSKHGRNGDFPSEAEKTCSSEPWVHLSRSIVLVQYLCSDVSSSDERSLIKVPLTEGKPGLVVSGMVSSVVIVVYAGYRSAEHCCSESAVTGRALDWSKSYRRHFMRRFSGILAVLPLGSSTLHRFSHGSPYVTSSVVTELWFSPQNRTTLSLEVQNPPLKITTERDKLREPWRQLTNEVFEFSNFPIEGPRSDHNHQSNVCEM